MGGGGGTERSTTTQQIIPELRGAYGALGSIAQDVLSSLAPSMEGYFTDQTPQQVAGMTGLQDDAYNAAGGILSGGSPQAWQDAYGMYSALGNIPGWGGVDLGGIMGWGGGQPAPQAAGATKGARMEDGLGGGGAPSPNPTPEYDPTGGGGYDPTGGGQPIEGGGDARAPTETPPGGGQPPWMTGGTPHGGIAAPGMGQGPQSGQVREIEAFDMADWMKNMSRGGGGSSYSASSGGGGGYEGGAERIGDVLSSMDFANHPALASALDVFAKTALPGIENSMIGAGLGRSGAAANAISTGKANIALPVMQQLIQGELTQRGQDVTQRGQDIAAQTAANNAARQAAAQGASLKQQQYMAELAHAQVMRGQDIGMRQQDIGLRGQDINALLQQGVQALQARGQDINALISGAGGLSSLGGQEVGLAQGAVDQAMRVGGAYQDTQNQMYESEFQAANRPFDRIMQMAELFAPGAMGSGGTTTTTTGGGGK